MTEDERYLLLGGWLENNQGWYHPPHCTASWPLDEAIKKAKMDANRGLRMDRTELLEYLTEIGIEDPQDYIKALLD